MILITSELILSAPMPFFTPLLQRHLIVRLSQHTTSNILAVFTSKYISQRTQIIVQYTASLLWPYEFHICLKNTIYIRRHKYIKYHQIQYVSNLAFKFLKKKFPVVVDTAAASHWQHNDVN